MNVFDYVNDISLHKEDVMKKEGEKDYIPYVVNRNFSFYPETVLIANEMNQHHFLGKCEQFYFYFHMIPKRKRYSQWKKADTTNINKIETLKAYYKISTREAKLHVEILNDLQMEELEKRLDRGGKNG